MAADVKEFVRQYLHCAHSRAWGILPRPYGETTYGRRIMTLFILILLTLVMVVQSAPMLFGRLRVSLHFDDVMDDLTNFVS